MEIFSLSNVFCRFLSIALRSRCDDFTFPVTISLFRRITHRAADTRAEKAAKITRKSIAFNNYTIRSDAERSRGVKLARVGERLLVLLSHFVILERRKVGNKIKSKNRVFPSRPAVIGESADTK